MRHLFIIILTALSLSLCAQNVRRVSGEFTYYAEGNETPNQAKIKALEGAKLKALATEFGTLMSQDTYSEETANNGEESNYFSQMTSSEVKGEWIEDLSEPEYSIDFVQDMLVVKCKVSGKAREISNESIDFEATVLKNGTEKRYKDVSFKQDDNLFLHFRSPSDGYVAVYYVDETPTAFCLLPYMSNNTGQQKVKRGEEYVFFSSDRSKTEGVVDELRITCDKDIENDRVYVIFSPNPFTKANDEQVSDYLPRQLSYEDFSKWLSKNRRRDPKMGLKVIRIEIRK